MAKSVIKNAVAKTTEAKPTGLNAQLNSFLDSEKLRGRFDELLGKRAPQFVSSMVSMINASPQLQEAFYSAPMTVVQSCLKAASFDLPIDQNLGYAYVVPFRNKGKMEAQFILGWKGMHQLALRTGVYQVINIIDVREGELKFYDRLTEEIKIDFIADDDERDTLPVIGYVGYYRLINGASKTIYMTRKQIEAHERKHRKGNEMGFGWKRDWDAMARKTVYRQLIGKWGVMSIEYRSNEEARKLADQMAEEDFFEAPDFEVDPTTGEVTEANIDQYGDEYGPELTGGA